MKSQNSKYLINLFELVQSEIFNGLSPFTEIMKLEYYLTFDGVRCFSPFNLTVTVIFKLFLFINYFAGSNLH